ncbi:hypothetical protein SISNIDRAFT_493458 [Sistotremastrum niveocremeum HHB9708]|uniref:Cyanovirin-N domain-containing protein n=1 Tax=Sistotremastrum niveocremeum HHB9708 TaxID=1314777 RepID=A0A164YW76_9AGAM|nr:hypothetical protein SISNIDRAFT_493458 [Sistotremastrum niveocremeum HHB9708]
MRFSIATFVAVATLVSTAAGAILERSPLLCEDGSEATILSEKIVDGKPLVHAACPVTTVEKREPETSLTKRGYDLCGAPCTTYCIGGSGGPNPNDCSVIATDYHNDGEFTLTANNYLIWTYGSCEISMYANGQDIVYCWDYNNLAGVINYVAWNCQSQENAKGGTCQFYGNTDISYVKVETV